MNIKVNGVDLYYEQAGSGTQVILLHGNGESSRIFDVLISQLKKDHAVYAIDSRGHGQSQPVNDFDYESMMADVAAFIRQSGLEKPALYGFSDGGIIGLLLAMKHPDLLSKLIVSGANLDPRGVKTTWYWFFKMIYFFKGGKLLRMMLTQPHIQPDDLKKIQVPVLVLAGSKDMIRRAHTETIARHIPNAQLQILANENHSSYVTHSEKLYFVIKPFLEL